MMQLYCVRGVFVTRGRRKQGQLRSQLGLNLQFVHKQFQSVLRDGRLIMLFHLIGNTSGSMRHQDDDLQPLD